MANTPPVAVDDSVRVEKNGRINIDVLANDSDADGDSIRSRGPLTDPTHARLLVRNTDGTMHYRPELAFVGRDSFVYLMEDGQGGLSGATVYITVFPTYHAIDDTLFTLVDRANNLPVLANDWVDPQDSIWVSSITPGTHTDRVVVNTNQTVFYRPAAGFVGVDTLAYTAETVSGRTYAAQVYVNVLLPNAALNDTIRIRESGRVNIWPLVNDRVAPGDTLRLISFGQTSEHSERIVLNGDGSIHYRPLPGFVGLDGFPYTATDSSGTELSAQVVIEVLSLNIARNDTVAVRESGRVNIDVLANDAFFGDSAQELLTFTQGAHSERVVRNTDGTLHYRPTPGFIGTDRFDYEIYNGRGEERISGTVVVEVLPIDAFFLVQPDTVVLFPGQGRIVNVLANDRHVENLPMTVSEIEAPFEAVVTGDGQIFMRAEALPSALSIAYRIRDNRDGSVSARLTVVPADGEPAATARDDSSAVDRRDEAVLSVLTNDSGVVQLVDVTPPVHGQVSVLEDGKTLRYLPEPDYEGEDMFYYIGEGPTGEQVAARVVLTLGVFNRAPVAVADTVRIGPGHGVVIDVLANDRDADGDTLRVVSVQNSEKGGTGRLTRDGRVFFRAVDGFLGTDAFGYSLVDHNGATATGQVVVQSQNSFLTLEVNDDTLFAWIGARVNIDVLQNDLGNGLTVAETIPGFHSERVVINSDGTVHYRPAESFVDGDVFVYTVRDAVGQTASALVHVVAQDERPGDFDSSGTVDFSDFLRFVQGFGHRDGDPEFDSLVDLNHDGEVGFADFLQFVNAFGK